jgi:outer membrane protein OmpA-like peptidoglycan-associated protein
MKKYIKSTYRDTTNPYIALSDLLINLVLIIVAIFAIGKYMEDLSVKTAMKELKRTIDQQYKTDGLPVSIWNDRKDDPPGVQRFVFYGKELFDDSPSQVKVKKSKKPIQYENISRLNKEGKKKITSFAKALSTYQKISRYKWKRIQVEGHTKPSWPTKEKRIINNWELPSSRAISVLSLIDDYIQPPLCVTNSFLSCFYRYKCAVEISPFSLGRRIDEG